MKELHDKILSQQIPLGQVIEARFELIGHIKTMLGEYESLGPRDQVQAMQIMASILENDMLNAPRMAAGYQPANRHDLTRQASKVYAQLHALMQSEFIRAKKILSTLPEHPDLLEAHDDKVTCWVCAVCLVLISIPHVYKHTLEDEEKVLWIHKLKNLVCEEHKDDILALIQLLKRS